jgi:hypothetical protein
MFRFTIRELPFWMFALSLALTRSRIERKGVLND